MFDEALSVARWVAERTGNPRLRWRAYTLAAGAAHLDAELDEAKRFRRNAARFQHLDELARRVRRLEGAAGAQGDDDE